MSIPCSKPAMAPHLPQSKSQCPSSSLQASSLLSFQAYLQPLSPFIPATQTSLLPLWVRSFPRTFALIISSVWNVLPVSAWQSSSPPRLCSNGTFSRKPHLPPHLKLQTFLPTPILAFPIPFALLFILPSNTLHIRYYVYYLASVHQPISMQPPWRSLFS